MTRRRGGIEPSTRRVAALAAGACILAACSGGSAAPIEASAGTPSPSDVSTTPSGSPAPTDEELAVAAYQGFLDAIASAVAQDESADDAPLEELATGQALAAAQARVVGLAAQNRTARGDLTADVQDIELSDGAAEISDCFVNELVEYDRDTDEQLADQAGTRFGATARLEREGDTWVVTEFEESGFCVPDDIASEVASAYLAFWSAVAEAGRPPDPDAPALLATAAGDQLAGLQERLRAFAVDGLEVRGDHQSHPTVVRVARGDTVAYVTDCRELDPDGGVYDAETGELVQGGAEPGERSMWEARLEIVDGAWKVVDADLREEDSTCDPASS